MGREVWQQAIFISKPLKDPRPLIGLRTQKTKRSKDERRLKNSKLGGMQPKRYDDHYF
jgi:hypothetical protein